MHLIVDGTGDHDATGLGKFLQPRRDVDPVAIDVGAVDHHISQIDADAKPHAMRLGWVRILVGNFLLNLDRALHGLDDAGELGDHGVAPGIHDPPVMARHQSGNGGAVAAQRPQRSRFVCFHEAGISVDIGAQDGGQPPFHLVVGHRPYDSPTSRRMHGASHLAPKKALDILGRKMAFFEEGEGRPIVFLHGNPTSSYLWRNVIPELRGQGRLIALDMIGMGDSEKLPNPGPALGFDWASAHPDRVCGIAYMEAIVHPIPDWTEWDPALAPVFQGFRSEAGEKMILDDNIFVERLLFGSHVRELSEAAKAEYRRPFLRREDRWPTLSWPRQLPIVGEPPHIIELVQKYGKWMSENDIPKLFINAEPGTLLKGRVREFCRTWKNQTEATVQGRHFIQEDSGPEIGRHIKAWLQTFSQS